MKPNSEMEPFSDPAEQLLSEYLLRKLEERAEPLEEFLAAHPEHADTLRRRLERIDVLEGSANLAALPELPGRFDDFELIGVLGEGAMGVVFEARQVSLDRAVAIKVLARDLSLNSRSIERFEREVSALADMDHPGVVRVIGSGVVDGKRYIAMDLVRGESLRECLHRTRGPLPPADVLRIGIAVAGALDHAHGRGVIHRDVKPSNIILREDGEPVLVDFGLARVEGSGEITRSGDFVGTLAYVAPEQAGGEPADARADIYGLGATLAHLALGEVVQRVSTVAEVLRLAESSGPSERLRKARALPRDLRLVLAKAIASDPRERYATSADLRQDLVAIRDGLPIVAARRVLFLRSKRWIVRKRTTLALVASLATILVFALFLADNRTRALGLEKAGHAKFESDLMDARLAAHGGHSLATSLFAKLKKERPSDLRAFRASMSFLLRTPVGHRTESVTSELGLRRARELLELASFEEKLDPAIKLMGDYLASGEQSPKDWAESQNFDGRANTSDAVALAEYSTVLGHVFRQTDSAIKLALRALEVGELQSLSERDLFEVRFALAKLTCLRADPQGIAAARAAYAQRPSCVLTGENLALSAGSLFSSSENHNARVLSGFEREAVIRLAERVAFQGREYPNVVQNMGYVLHNDLDEPALALALYRQAIELEPSASAKFNLSNAMFRLGESTVEAYAFRAEVENEYGHLENYWRARVDMALELFGAQHALEDLGLGIRTVAPSEVWKLHAKRASVLGGLGEGNSESKYWPQLRSDALIAVEGMSSEVDWVVWIRDIMANVPDDEVRELFLQRTFEFHEAGLELHPDVLLLLTQMGRLPR